jgi:hypothetical protein
MRIFSKMGNNEEYLYAEMRRICHRVRSDNGKKSPLAIALSRAHVFFEGSRKDGCRYKKTFRIGHTCNLLL